MANDTQEELPKEKINLKPPPRLMKGMIIRYGNHRYKVTARRPNGKLTLREMSLLPKKEG